MRPGRTIVAALMMLAAAPALAQGPQVQGAQIPGISAQSIREHTRELSGDAYEGRAPATPGERKTIDYIATALKAAGAVPVSGDSYFQQVPLVEITANPDAALTVAGGKGKTVLASPEDAMLWTKRVVPSVTLKNSPMVFVGYGIVAPEYGWNDYAGLDVKGKTVVMFVNDPGYATRDPALFNGKAMTYYGRWTYKFEEAARQGAAAALIVHETAAASYPWAVVAGSWSGPQLDMARPDRGAGRVLVEGWITSSAASRLFASAGLDLRALKAASVKRGFKPVPMGLKASTKLTNTLRYSDSANVMGIIPGSQTPDEVVLYTAHWDHLGRGIPVDGDDIYNGAVDNAAGIGSILAIAEAIGRMPEKPKRSIGFLALTAEESGLLGSAYYAEHPLVPLVKTVGGINIDAPNVIGPATSFVVVGAGKSELEDILARYAAEQGRKVEPEDMPEAGFFYRSDHFSLAKVGVPMLYAEGGHDIIGKEPDWGRKQAEAYTANAYHKPADEFSDALDFAATARDMDVMMQVGLDMANSNAWPNWRPTAEFRAARDAMMVGSR